MMLPWSSHPQSLRSNERVFAARKHMAAKLSTKKRDERLERRTRCSPAAHCRASFKEPLVLCAFLHAHDIMKTVVPRGSFDFNLAFRGPDGKDDRRADRKQEARCFHMPNFQLVECIFPTRMPTEFHLAAVDTEAKKIRVGR
jgi:hypothetical protein